MNRDSVPALIRHGIWTTFGGALLAGGAALVVSLLIPPAKPGAAAGGCGCGCDGTAPAAVPASLKVYG